jgi:hypothetical protein
MIDFNRIRCFQTNFNRTDEALIMEGPRISLEGLVRLLLSTKDGKAAVFYAVVKNCVVGCIHAEQAEDQAAEFGLFAVDPEFQSSGIGRSESSPGARLTATEKWGGPTGEKIAVPCWPYHLSVFFDHLNKLNTLYDTRINTRVSGSCSTLQRCMLSRHGVQQGEE